MANLDESTVQDPHAAIREEVRKLCLEFPGPYWRALDREGAYPAEFVRALSEGGWLAALIPEEYGGSGLSLSAAAAILEEVQRAGCNGGACHAQMYIMGALLRHGNAEQKALYLPKIASGELRLQAFGVTEPTQRHGHYGAENHGAARRRPLRRERPEDLDLARGILGPDAAAGAHHPT